MQEFSSISVSSYDAASLADRLTQKSADGWEVVAIVPAGTNVVAYLARHAASGLVVPHDVDEHIDASDSEPAPGSDDDLSLTLASTTTPEAAAAETALGTVTGAEVAPEPEVIEPEVAPEPEVVEPAGWGTQPSPQPETTTDAAPETTTDTPSVEQVVAASSDESTGHSEQETAAANEDTTPTEAASEQAEQAAGSAPAGWYADPAGRFELRYWDGTQWTEHVSRSGQQYTDPPVA